MIIGKELVIFNKTEKTTEIVIQETFSEEDDARETLITLHYIEYIW